MSAATAIGMVSTSLWNLLTGEIDLSPEVNVTILAPDESGGNRRINLFLYKVQENPMFRNADWQVRGGAPETLIPPPLSLNLFYLMTPYAGNDPQTGNSTAHAILGEAMRVFHENPIVPENYLDDGLKAAREQIRIMQVPVDMEELSRVWSTFSEPFRLSVMYEVSVVQLDVRLEPGSLPRLPRRVATIGAPSVSATFRPPLVTEILPPRGSLGTTITFRGQHLAGRRAYVRVMGRQIVEALEITADDQFTITLPTNAEFLPPGLHEIRVDVSSLFRRTFVFEIVP